MRVAFVGASKFGLRCLDRILDLECCDVVGVVTAPRTFAISYRPQGVRNVLYADMRGLCEERMIDCVVIDQGMKDPVLLQRIRSWAPQLFVVAGWYHILPRSWREVAPAYGLHASLLPDYSGGAPLVWALINGEKSTGITLFQFDDGVDSGPVVGQATTEIWPEDTIATLYERIETLGLGLLEQYLPRLADGTAPLVTQDESKRRLFPQRGPEDGVIDWSQPAGRIRDFIRAQTRPYPGAFTFYRGTKVTIWKSSWGVSDNHDPLQVGELRERNDEVTIGCGSDTTLVLGDLCVQGIDMTAVEWLRSMRHGSQPVRFS